MKEADIVKRTSQFSQTGVFPKTHVEGLFSHIRQTIEHRAWQDHFPVLKTYCDWTLHPQLNRRGHHHILKSIDQSFPDVPLPAPFGPGSGFAERLVGLALRVRPLKDDLSSFFGAIEADVSFLNHDQTFKPFVAALLVSLVGKPIQMQPADYLLGSRVDVGKLNKALGRRKRSWFPSSVHFEIGQGLGYVAKDHSCLRCIVRTVSVEWGSSIEWSFQVWDLHADPIVDD